MSENYPRCIGHYNFDHIVQFAKMRYIDGWSTIKLLQQVHTDTEREEVALVCMLDIDDEVVTNIRLNCRYSPFCQVKNCRERIRSLIEQCLKY